MVRIRFPPALSPLRTSFSGGKRGKIRGDDKGRSRRVSTSSGTDGSNPAPSGAESGANLAFGNEPHRNRLKIVLGQTLGRATVALIQGSIVFLVCLAAGFRPAQPLLLPLALLFMALIAIMCTAIGTAVGSVLQDMQGFQLIINFIVLPLFFFSSTLFPVPDLPGAMRVVVRLNPLSYGVDGLRGVLTSGFAFGVATDFAVLGGLAAILLAIGAYLFSKIEV